MKLKQEYSFFVSLLVLFVVIGISSAFFIYEKQTLKKDIKDREKRIFRGFVEMAIESLSLHDELLLLNYMNHIKKINENVVYMFYKSSEGYVLSVPKKEELKVKLEDLNLALEEEEKRNIVIEGEEVLELAYPIYEKGIPSGEIRIGFSQDVLKREVKARMTAAAVRIFFIALITLMLSILAALVLASKITKPIRKLSDGAHMIGEGELEQKINIKSSNELRDLAEEFNKMAVKLKELDDMKDNFISSVSHELKSPLTYIKGYIELFLGDDSIELNEDHKEYFNVIRKNIERLSRFITDILDLSKIKVGRIVIEKNMCAVGEIIDEAAAFCKPGAEERGITIKTEVPDSIPEINCDKEKICQVLNNLIGNALKFTPEGGSITLSAEDKPEHVELSVKDTGIGIPADQLESVFEKFKQVKSNSDKISNVKGTGLGLAIVKGILNAHGERVWVESDTGKGCDFRFTLTK